MADITGKEQSLSNPFLLDRLKEGDRNVFTLLFNEYYSGLVIYADYYLHDLEQSEDIVQSVFISLWENKHTLKSASFRFFLVNSVKNSCIDLIRKEETRNKYNLRQVNREADYEPDFWTEAELKKMIESAIEKLPPKCREIFILSRYKNLKSREIADKLNLSPRTVETQIAHALKVLREDLKDYLFQLFFFF